MNTNMNEEDREFLKLYKEATPGARKAVEWLLKKGQDAQEGRYTLRCCICGRLFESKYSFANNPWPLMEIGDNDAGCCDECDRRKVMPARDDLHKGESLESVIEKYMA
ncbi:MAG: hypothetical protein IKQ49_00150 [Eubacterium sp.]|nr:hypothetical protein [Eubacterium sp.]